MNARFYLEQDRKAELETQPRTDGLDDFETAIQRAKIRDYETAIDRLNRASIPILMVVAAALLLLALWP